MTEASPLVEGSSPGKQTGPDLQLVPTGEAVLAADNLLLSRVALTETVVLDYRGGGEPQRRVVSNATMQCDPGSKIWYMKPILAAVPSLE